MKIWDAYGSEHSSNILVIGRFKSTKDAQTAKKMIDDVSKLAEKHARYEDRPHNRFSDELMEGLKKANCWILSPTELVDFLSGDISVDQENEKITINTEEYDLGAFLKLMIHHGAKIEMFSRHDYPEQEAR